MKINNLVLKNFKSVTDESFTFDNGIICFAGDNGEGKSTVIHAILMLLFNSYDLSFKDYINWNASKFDISMTFEHNGERWYEEFEYSEKSGSKRILKNIDTGDFWENSSAISKLSEIVDFDLAKASIVSMENDQNLITTTPAKRREYLKGLYDLEFREQLDSITNDLIKISEEQTKHEAEISALEKQEFPLKEYKNEPCDEKRYIEAKDDLGVLVAKKGELESQKRKKDEIESKISEINLAIRRCVMQKSSIDEEIRRAEDEISQSQRSIEDAENEDKLTELNARLDKINTEFESKKTALDSDISKFAEEVKRLEAVPDVREEREKIRAQIRDKELDQRTTQTLISQSQDKLEILNTGRCPTCGHEISEEEIRNEEEVLNKLKKKNDELDSELSSLSIVNDQLRERQEKRDNDIRLAEADLAKSEGLLQLTMSNHSRDVTHIEHEIEMHKTNKENEILRLRYRIDNGHKIIESQQNILKQTEYLLEEHRRSIKNLYDDLESIGDPQTVINTLSEEMNAVESLVHEYEDVLQYNKWVSEYNSEQKERSGKRDAEILEFTKNLRDLSERKSMIEKAKTIVVREFPSFVISYMVKSLENYVNEFLTKVYPKYQIKITESKNSLAITYGPNKADVKMASGFEKSAFSLAYMYALGKMQKYGILIIDEGDGAASDNNSLLFYNTVAKSQEFFPQIFCITHKEVAKELLQNTYHAQVYVAESGHYSKE